MNYVVPNKIPYEVQRARSCHGLLVAAFPLHSNYSSSFVCSAITRKLYESLILGKIGTLPAIEWLLIAFYQIWKNYHFEKFDPSNSSSSEQI